MAHATRYEVIVEQGGQRYLVAYTAAHSKAAILRALRNRGQEFLATTGADRVQNVKGQMAWDTANGWRVRFSGRTMLTAKQEGELEYIGTVAKRAALTGDAR